MWGFVRGLGTTTPKYVAERRKRAAPFDTDMAAYGAGFAPNPPLLRRAAGSRYASTASLASSGGSVSLGASEASGSSSCLEAAEGGDWAEEGRCGSTRAYVPRKRRAGKALAAALLAGGAALVLKAAVGGGGQRSGGKRPDASSGAACAAAE
jgi:hypothetical protein